jgi:hypothetical protein
MPAQRITTVVIHRTGNRVRVRLPLTVVHETYYEEWPAFAIVFRDSDDSATHERVITTTKGFANRLVDLGARGDAIACRRAPHGLERDRTTNPLRPLVGRFM